MFKGIGDIRSIGMRNLEEKAILDNRCTSATGISKVVSSKYILSVSVKYTGA